MKCFVRSRGPRVLIWKVDRADEAEIWVGDFSGCRIPGMKNARRRREGVSEVDGKRVLQRSDAAAIVDSSVILLYFCQWLSVRKWGVRHVTMEGQFDRVGR